MKKSAHRCLAIFAVMAVPFWATACTDESHSQGEGVGDLSAASEAAGEHARSEGAGEHAEGAGEHARSEGGGEHARSEGGGEHSEGGEHGEHGSEGEGEESGVQIGREDTWDATRNGARLVLSFDPTSNAFVGTVENTTRQTLCAVRVEVHLSTGTELGPTERTVLPAGGTTEVELPTAGEAFSTWTAHPEISPCRGG